MHACVATYASPLLQKPSLLPLSTLGPRHHAITALLPRASPSAPAALCFNQETMFSHRRCGVGWRPNQPTSRIPSPGAAAAAAGSRRVATQAYDSSPDSLVAVVKRFKFQADNKFKIAEVQAVPGHPASGRAHGVRVVKGTFEELRLDEVYRFEGKVTDHEKYGESLTVRSANETGLHRPSHFAVLI